MSNRLDELRDVCMVDNFDSYGADAVTEIAISTAEDILNLLCTRGIIPAHVAPLNHGGVQIEIEISPEGNIA
jgi:hypothetical protein